MKAPIKNEKGVKVQVKKLLDLHNWFWFMPPSNAFGRSGISDIIALRGGVFLAIETKFNNKTPTAMQIAFLNSVRAEGGFGFTVHEGNLRQLEHWLNAFNIASSMAAQGKDVPPEIGSIMLNSLHSLMLDKRDKETEH